MSLALCLLLVQAPDAEDERLPWEGRFLYSYRNFAPGRTDWHETRASVRRFFEGGSVALEAVAAHRFAQWDEALAVDAYVNLWEKAYANVRGQGTIDPDVLPGWDVSAELFQGFDGGWEPSASYRHIEAEDENVDVYGVSLAKYFGDEWYLRARAAFSQLGGETAFSPGFSVRYFFDTKDDYVEAGAGLGEEVITLAPGPDVDILHTRYYYARAQVMIDRAWGFEVTLDFWDTDRIPDSVGLSVGLIARW